MNLYCLNCGHEFSSLGARKKVDKSGTVLGFVVGGLLVVGGIWVLWAALTEWIAHEHRTRLVIYAIVGIVAGILSAFAGWGSRKGYLTYCPKCNEPRGVFADSPDAKHAKKKAQQRTDDNAI